MAESHKLQKFLDELPKKTGKELQDFLNELVATHWQEGKKYKFRMPTDEEPPAFSIEVTPTPNQPGDGRVTFRRYDSITSTWREHAPTWRELLPPVLDPQFPLKRQTFLTTCLKDANFNEESTQANVLLLFEVARRRSDDTFYATSEGKKIQPIYTRNNAEDAIEAVMEKSNDDAYKNWVSLIRGDNTFKNLFIPFCIYDGLKFNWIANCRFQCIDLLLSRLLLCRDQIMACWREKLLFDLFIILLCEA